MLIYILGLFIYILLCLFRKIFEIFQIFVKYLPLLTFLYLPYFKDDFLAKKCFCKHFFNIFLNILLKSNYRI